MTTALDLILDPEDEHLVARGWRVTRQGYVAVGASSLLHRLVTSAPSGTHVDHINGNKLDNRRANLRVVTPQVNQANRKSRNRNNTSGERGVVASYSARSPWRAQITVNRKCIHLGNFASIAEAVAARQKAELEYFGETCPR